jgi:hypothetical protein
MYTEVVLSPLLRHSPQTVERLILEPMLRWLLVRHGCALSPTFLLRQGQLAHLVALPADSDALAATEMIELAPDASLHNGPTIVSAAGLAYPLGSPFDLDKPPRRRRRLLNTARLLAAGERPGWRRRLPLAWLAALVETPPLTAHAASHPPPEASAIASLAVIEKGPPLSRSLTAEEAAENLSRRMSRRHASTAAEAVSAPLVAWQGRDLRPEERQIIAAALRRAELSYCQSPIADCWPLPTVEVASGSRLAPRPLVEG